MSTIFKSIIWITYPQRHRTRRTIHMAASHPGRRRAPCHSRQWQSCRCDGCNLPQQNSRCCLPSPKNDEFKKKLLKPLISMQTVHVCLKSHCYKWMHVFWTTCLVYFLVDFIYDSKEHKVDFVCTEIFNSFVCQPTNHIKHIRY